MSRILRWTFTALIIAAFCCSPAVAGMWGPSQGGRVSVTVYEHADFKGREATFFGDTAWLPRGISSIRVNGQCTVTLYNNYNFQGARQSVTSDVRDLQGSRVGNDRVLSLTISPFRAGDPGSRNKGEVILYEHPRFQGRHTKVFGDIPNLIGTNVGNDAVSSIRIKDAEVTVYEHINYQGRSQTFNGSVERMTGTRVGNDSISSIRVRWFDGHGRGQGGKGGSGKIQGKPYKQN